MSAISKALISHRGARSLIAPSRRATKAIKPFSKNFLNIN